MLRPGRARPGRFLGMTRKILAAAVVTICYDTTIRYEAIRVGYDKE